MNDDIDELKRDYRAITAPPHLATRINASVAGSRTRTRFWIPAAVTCSAIIALVWMMPDTNRATPDAIAKPSMSALAALKPAVPPPSLSQLRSVSVPRMPTRPMVAAPPQPQTNHQKENRVLKEKNNEYI